MEDPGIRWLNSIEDEGQGDHGVVVQHRTAVRKPHLYRVLLLNDDYTPMDFVVDVLMSHFEKSHSEATQIMLEVHHDGSGLCGVYPREIAETKVAAVTEEARRNQFPLKCLFEQE